jgi:hypothetical protein
MICRLARNYRNALRRAQAGEGEAGYILLTTVLLIVPLITLTAIAVDIGGWYLQASHHQKAAEAGSLAGVVHLPNEPVAIAEATKAVEANGYYDGVDGVSVTITRIGANQLRVTVSDGAIQYLSKSVVSGFDIERSATAQQVKPTPLGSPRNSLGGGNLDGADPENIWLAINGYCSVRENGDLLNSGLQGAFVGPGYTCAAPATPNPDYDTEGYEYGVTIAQPSGQNFDVRVYDGSYTPNGNGPPDQAIMWGFNNIDTIYTLLAPDGTVLNTVTANSGDTWWENRWRSIGTISGATPGTYRVRVETPTNENGSYGVNSFALRTFTGGTYTKCTTEVGQPGFSATCPQIHGIDYVSVRTLNAGAVADFYLADVNADNAGKTMEINLFDPGEGADSIQLLDPNGNPVSFRWSTDCATVSPPTGGCSGTTTSLDVSGTGTQPGPRRLSSSRYNDRSMILTVDLPNDYLAQFGTNSWWKVRYSFGGGATPSDRTTWGVKILGDPLRLVE